MHTTLNKLISQISIVGIALVTMLLTTISPNANASLNTEELSQARQNYIHTLELAQSKIKSIVIVPIINQTTSQFSSPALQSQLQRVFLQLGYYVLPPVITNQFFKDNGVALGEDVLNIPANKITQALGADAVVYVELKHFGREYTLLIKNLTFKMDVKLVDSHNQVQFARENMGFTVPIVKSNSLTDFILETLGHILQEATTTDSQERKFAYELASKAYLYNPNFHWDFDQGGVRFGPYSPLYFQDNQLNPSFYGLTPEDVADIKTKLKLPE